MQDITAYINELNAQLDARVTFEREQQSKDNIFSTIAQLRKDVTRESIAEQFMHHNVSASIINRALRSDARINVYTLRKCENVASFLAKSELLNHFTRAILLTAEKMQQSDVLMTRKDALAACHSETKLKDAKREKLLVKTPKIVSANTAASQYSSSLDALVIFGALTKTYDKENNEAYRVSDAESAKLMLEMLNA